MQHLVEQTVTWTTKCNI